LIHAIYISCLNPRANEDAGKIGHAKKRLGNRLHCGELKYLFSEMRKSTFSEVSLFVLHFSRYNRHTHSCLVDNSHKDRVIRLPCLIVTPQFRSVSCLHSKLNTFSGYIPLLSY